MLGGIKKKIGHLRDEESTSAFHNLGYVVGQLEVYENYIGNGKNSKNKWSEGKLKKKVLERFYRVK